MVTSDWSDRPPCAALVGVGIRASAFFAVRAVSSASRFTRCESPGARRSCAAARAPS